MPKSDNDSLRRQRLAIQREIADLVEQQQRWYSNYVKPNVAEARMITTGGKRGGETKPMSIADAERLDDSPTGRFEKGRAHIEAISMRIRALRTTEARLANEIVRPPVRRIDWTGRLERHIDKTLERP